MRRRLLFVTLTAVITFTAGCGSSSPGPNGVQSKSGDQIVAAAVAATKQQSSFHFVETANQGSSRVSVIGDVGRTSGDEHVTALSEPMSGISPSCSPAGRPTSKATSPVWRASRG